MDKVFFTICSKNYQAFAKTLLDSLAETHPDIDRYLLLADKKDNSLSNNSVRNNCHIFWVEDIDIPNLNRMAFMYNIMEFNTSVKPFFIKQLFDMGYRKIVYLDPDIYVYRPLSYVFSLLDDNCILLTPHILSPIPEDGLEPTELHISTSGMYNLGFIALRKSSEVDSFLSWWMDRLREKCVIDHAHGIFVDQRWVDFVPSFLQKVFIIREKGYNVAYWNLHERLPISFDESGPRTVGEPLYFYHFSGLDIYNPHHISKFQNRYTLDSDNGLMTLCTKYQETIMGNKHHKYKQLSYGYDVFDNGRRISPLTRKLYRSVHSSNVNQLNPFIVNKDNIFYNNMLNIKIRMVLKYLLRICMDMPWSK